MGKYRHIKGHYAIVIDGHTTFPEDVILKLKRLDYLEGLLKKESDLKQEMLDALIEIVKNTDGIIPPNKTEKYKAIIQKAKES